MSSRQPVYVDTDWLDWTAVGPLTDPQSHLMAPLFIGTSPMVLHAAEVVIGAQTPLRVADIDGRQYLLVAVPNIDGRFFA